MKKMIIVLSCLVLLTGYAFTQEPASHTSDHYTVISHVGADHARSTAEMMEAYFSLFESYMHFDPDKLSASLKVRIFSEKEKYDAYLDSLLSEKRDSFVFIQYPDPRKSELVGFYGGNDELYRRRLIHHGFVQYLKSFIANPPLWLQKGFAVYFEHAEYNEDEQKAVFKHNYDWVPTIRKLLQESRQAEGDTRLIPVNSLLYIDSEQANKDLEAFYAQVWGTIEFLAHSDQKQYNRLLWDSISALKPEVSQQKNEQNVVEQAFTWVSKETLAQDYIDFVQGIETFPELVREGMDRYTAGKLEEAKSAFSKALELRSDHYVPYYYLGLINYDLGDYSMAEYHYHNALDTGGKAPLINYALGVNAYADNRLEDARFYLNKSVEAGETYTDRVESLRKKITARQSGGTPSGNGNGDGDGQNGSSGSGGSGGDTSSSSGGSGNGGEASS
jgi:tetratricopeptide (TPR) repeat protein